MGTSSIFDGPVHSLIPDDYDDPTSDTGDGQIATDGDKPSNSDQPDDGDQDTVERHPAPAYKWKYAKSAMTDYVRGRSSDPGRVLSRYVRASGGSKKLARSSVSGTSAAIGLGRLIQDFRNKGVVATLQLLQIDCVGKSVREVLSKLVNVISTKSDSKEDVVARGAVIEATIEMYRIISENGENIESLQRIDEPTFRDIVQVFMSEYIFKRVMSVLQSRFEKYENDPKKAAQKEQELKEYVKVKVEFILEEIRPEALDYSAKSIIDEMNKLFERCYRAFEGYL